MRRLVDYLQTRIGHSRRALGFLQSSRNQDYRTPVAEAGQANETLYKPSDTQRLTHLNQAGAAHMVNISNKPETSRSATAVATLLFSDRRTYAALSSYQIVKGDVIAVARVAAFQAAKKTADLIPLAHPSLHITAMSVDIDTFLGSEKAFVYTTITPRDESTSLNADRGGVTVTAHVECQGKTGVEMEAITAATVGVITMYDMLKAIDKGMVIMGARVIEKKGGKSGDWTWDERTNNLIRPKDSPEANFGHDSSSTVSSAMPGSARRLSDIDEWNEGLAAEFSTNEQTSTEPMPSTPSGQGTTLNEILPTSNVPEHQKEQTYPEQIIPELAGQSVCSPNIVSHKSAKTIPTGQQEELYNVLKALASPERESTVAQTLPTRGALPEVHVKSTLEPSSSMLQPDSPSTQIKSIDQISITPAQQISARDETLQSARSSSSGHLPASNDDTAGPLKSDRHDIELSDLQHRSSFSRQDRLRHERAARVLRAKLEKSIGLAKPFVKAVGKNFESAMTAEAQIQRISEDIQQGGKNKSDPEWRAESIIIADRDTWPGYRNHHTKKVDSQSFQEKRFRREWQDSVYGKGSWIR